MIVLLTKICQCNLLGAVNPQLLNFFVNNLFSSALRQLAAALSMRPSEVPDGRRVVSGVFGWGLAII